MSTLSQCALFFTCLVALATASFVSSDEHFCAGFLLDQCFPFLAVVVGAQLTLNIRLQPSIPSSQFSSSNFYANFLLDPRYAVKVRKVSWSFRMSRWVPTDLCDKHVALLDDSPAHPDPITTLPLFINIINTRKVKSNLYRYQVKLILHLVHLVQ